MEISEETREWRRKHMTVAVRSLDDPEDYSEELAMTPSERVALVEILRKQGDAFIQPKPEPELPRHAWPVVKTWR